MRRHWLGLVCLVLGVLAVGLMVIPPAVADERAPLPRSAAEDRRPKAGNSETTVSVGKFSFSWRKKHDAVESPAPAAPAKPPSTDWRRICTVAGLSTALLGILVSPLAFTRQRRSRPLAVSGAALCCAALAWQYIMVGIAIGVAVAVLLLVIQYATP